MSQWTVIETLLTLVPVISVIAGGAWWLSGTLTRFEETLKNNTDIIQRGDNAVDNLVKTLSDESDRITYLEFKVTSMEKEIQKLKVEIEKLKEDGV